MGIKLELPNEKLQSFSLPKFTIESAHNNIHDQLRQSGLEKLFGAGDTLSRMTADPRAQLSLVKQKAKIIVNEEGSEAAAVTIGGIATASVRTSIELKVNGPFAFAIVEKAAQEVLFEGIVRDPLEQQ